MNKSDSNSENFFDKYGLEVSTGEVEIGKTYPIYGMITKFIDDRAGSVVVELNHSITAYMSIPDNDKVEVLKQRAFEPGIFVSTIRSKGGSIEVDCNTVVFGKRQKFAA